MPRQLIDLGATPLLDIGSYARRGPARRDHLSQDEIELIARTVRRTPEVMVKVLSRGGQDLKAIGRHLGYLNRGGEVEFQTDDGQFLLGKGVEKELLEDWDLDLEEHRRKADLVAWSNRQPPKLVHKLMFSMPAGTPPEKVLAAVRNFAREEFGLKHRYAMVLHTDEPHPHVHVVVKAVGEGGIRLNIMKGTLREWRREFARNLREQGVNANATERAVRGEVRTVQSDGIFRAKQRGAAQVAIERARSVARSIVSGKSRIEPGRRTLRQTRDDVENGWLAASRILDRLGEPSLAQDARRFVRAFHGPLTDREQIASAIRELSEPRVTPSASERL